MPLSDPPSMTDPEDLNVGPVSEFPWANIQRCLHLGADLAVSSQAYRRWAKSNHHSHPYAEVLLCLNGSHFYGLHGKAITINPGTILLIPEYDVHDAWYYPAQKSCTDLWVHFTPNSTIRLNIVNHTKGMITRITPLACPDPALLGDFKRFAGFVSKPCNSDTQAPLGADVVTKKVEGFLLFLMYSLLESLATWKPISRPGNDVAVVEGVKEYIGTHLADPLTLRDLARVSGFSACYFQRLFHRVEGMTPHHFIETKRIQFACEQLRAGNSVTAVALMSGFSSCSQFDNVFKKQMQVSPTQWMRKLDLR